MREIESEGNPFARPLSSERVSLRAAPLKGETIIGHIPYDSAVMIVKTSRGVYTITKGGGDTCLGQWPYFNTCRAAKAWLDESYRACNDLEQSME
jgi:hypothetical protein